MEKKDLGKLGFQSLCCHAGQHADPQTGAHNTPIYQTSTFAFKNVQDGADKFAGEKEGYIYTRLGNPTQSALEEKMAALEGAEAAIATASGMSAISASVMAVAYAGDHILAHDCLYGCTHSLMEEILPRYGIEVTFADLSDLDNVDEYLQDNTKLVYLETPSNPTLNLVDIEEISKKAHAAGAKVIVDNTFMTPYLQNPLALGADMVVHSATKYIGGHGDAIAGIIAGKEEMLAEIRMTTLKDFGGIISPFNAWLLLRGLKTLPIRVDKHTENAMEVAEFLEAHDKVERVFYPGLESHPQHDLAKKQASGFGSMISFELKGGYAAGEKMMNNVNLATLAVSLGDVDTLIQHPASMTHAPVPREERLAAGITDGLVRISIGIEDVEDIIADLDNSLSVLADVEEDESLATV
ncbi:methionine gamma-lyase [Halanaerobium congolense]|uniref:L-methionine gamma-lyase n=1 Tax=Halanaerobium congolense TaxID=54121 RepID=A0A1M7MXA6_9FIRM|nr:methionine gamma-lyase [Halanaerobium congolense]TDX46422.1 methionine-gamma-lyase [Halanaerobium congolense]SDH01511.1 methionine-gamma-lyase [Halanaerobium congolense]SDJ16554.1 methionine-gamma-lyase [Halanaerobium congolense]SDK98292.1 methionine-gamma-lyase [Halanaerobium congolense]SDM96507.1 methionine-gamma-lyase [Halanaerobium congolense]